MATESSAVRVDDAYGRLRTEILEIRMPPGFQTPDADGTRSVVRAHRRGAANERLGAVERTRLTQS